MAAVIQTARDYQALAQKRLDPAVWAYLADGDSVGNERALADVRLMPRPLSDVRGGHTQVNLFGQTLEHPILLAPVAYQRLFHADGESASAMAAAAQGGQSIISSLASQPIETIVQAALQTGGQAPWFQLYWQGNRERTLRLLQRAIAAGCRVIVFTVDAPIKLATMQLPHGIDAVNLEKYSTPAPAGSVVFNGWMAQAPTWDDVIWLRQQTTLPLLLKGILHPDDAERVVDLGCDGLVVSNHGGRVLPGSLASLDALPAIIHRINGRVPVLFDSGIRHGRDVFAALSLGASAVMLGRPYVWGLAAQGAMGVAHMIRLLRDELEMTMALTGCAMLADINRQAVFLKY